MNNTVNDNIPLPPKLSSLQSAISSSVGMQVNNDNAPEIRRLQERLNTLQTRYIQELTRITERKNRDMETLAGRLDRDLDAIERDLNNLNRRVSQ
jgi:hypothetical protein